MWSERQLPNRTMEGNGSRMPCGEMGEEGKEVAKGVTEKGKEGVEEEEREGEEAEERKGEEKGRGGRGLRLLMCTLMTVKKRKKHRLRNREVGLGARVLPDVLCVCPTLQTYKGIFFISGCHLVFVPRPPSKEERRVWVQGEIPLSCWNCFCEVLQCDWNSI